VAHPSRQRRVGDDDDRKAACVVSSADTMGHHRSCQPSGLEGKADGKAGQVRLSARSSLDAPVVLFLRGLCRSLTSSDGLTDAFRDASHGEAKHGSRHSQASQRARSGHAFERNEPTPTGGPDLILGFAEQLGSPVRVGHPSRRRAWGHDDRKEKRDRSDCPHAAHLTERTHADKWPECPSSARHSS